MNSNVPIGADNEDAPWNQVGHEPKIIEVTVSITLSKTVKVEVNDYTTEKEKNEDGSSSIYYDYSECDLEQAVRDQIPLPTDSNQQFKDWIEDDFAVILE